jgi:hypothetical protein
MSLDAADTSVRATILHTRHNRSMAIFPSAIVNQAELAEAVEKATAKLDENEVRLVRYSIGVDMSGEMSIFFRILLSDYASQESRLGDVTTRVATILLDEIKPYDHWGVLPYFSFRSESEQRKRYDAAWE